MASIRRVECDAAKHRRAPRLLASAMAGSTQERNRAALRLPGNTDGGPEQSDPPPILFLELD
jgi:hypothetical protein